ncbi:cell division protein ZapA [Beggiatoa leptomitoformis]|uniref:Cell division protein ZapA n=1 Tax=Beggiatoa leptomitoformis TaxID=288004 RepID=A0A2N9YI65_9GAMM|nr:cell division protein ZapA [Beggiatoa leptomitoformis]ALG67666.1 cell division protein ZapA [Beggiatoa leptomitoformis]AUI70099.1 cell division protein ZapA [Beggiatoa leptomitoformis]
MSSYSGKTIPVSLHILDKDYVVACPEEEKETLIASANYLNKKVKEVRDGGKVVSTERIVVVSALNIIHEYFRYKQGYETENNGLKNQINSLQEKINLALHEIKR